MVVCCATMSESYAGRSIGAQGILGARCSDSAAAVEPAGVARVLLQRELKIVLQTYINRGVANVIDGGSEYVNIGPAGARCSGLRRYTVGTLYI